MAKIEPIKSEESGCGKIIFLNFLLLIVFFTLWYLYFHSQLAESVIVKSIACGLMTTLTLWIGRAILQKDHENALERAILGLPLIDGQWSAAVGKIFPSSPVLLTAPFSGQEAVVYKYWITRFGRRIPGPGMRISRKNTYLLTAYTGYAITPCEIHTSTRKVAVKGMPVLNADKKEHKAPEAYERAKNYIAATAFKDAYLEAESELNPGKDNIDLILTPTGIIKFDRRENPEPDLDGWSLDEICIKPGDQVCVYGMYSASRNCLMAPSRVISGRLFSLVSGDIEKVRETARLQRLFLYIIGLILIAAQVIILWRIIWAWIPAIGGRGAL